MDAQQSNDFYPQPLRDAEEELLKARPGASTRAHPAGVGLSGGGIRSATFSLGIFQALARFGLLEKVDYLSTVSGGGYFGSFYGRLFTREAITSLEDAGHALNGPPPEAANFDAKARILGWLRENGRYLSPRGSGDLLLMIAVILRNWVALHIALGSTVFLAAVGLVLGRVLVERGVAGMSQSWLAASRKRDR